MAKLTKVKQSEPISADFADLASHQLRTPLSGMKWMLELLQKSSTGILNKKQKDYIEKIYISNERVISLVNDLLEVFRIEQGETKLYLRPTDLPAIIDLLIRDKSREIKVKDLDVSFRVEKEPYPVVRTESVKIKQVLNNLISNAIMFTPHSGKITITLGLRDENTIICSVADNGMGIPKDEQKFIFNKFYRGTNAVAIESVGSGLGLYIAKFFVQALGGKIWFKSEEGKGTTFYFTLAILK